MPIHDWTQVSAGTFHHFHSLWIGQLSTFLNEGVLPPEYYAMAEQIAGEAGPDVLTLQGNGVEESSAPAGSSGGGTAVALMPPPVQLTATAEIDAYAQKRRTLVIQHSSEDRIVALIEILSPGNKASRHGLRRFLDKAVSALTQKIHLLIIDLHPPGTRDPEGIHGALWEEICDDPYSHPPERPLTLAAYSAAEQIKAYVVPVRVGDALPDMPLFLEPEACVLVPLEAAYQQAWRGVPRQVKRVLEQ